LLGGVVTFGI